MTNLSEDRPDDRNLPVRRLSTEEFELVIRRAAELQTRESERGAAEGITEAEAVRIGRELGLTSENLHRALAEVGVGPGDTGAMASLFGPEAVRAVRAIEGDATDLATTLERYLVGREYMTVLRRFPDRVLFTQASGMMAAMGRATSQIFNRSPLLKIDNLEVAVHPFEDGWSYVALSTTLKPTRTAAAASSLVGGGTAAATAGAVLGIAVAPPAAVVALPILGASYLFGRAYYRNLIENTHLQLESLLDRLEHRELIRRPDRSNPQLRGKRPPE